CGRSRQWDWGKDRPAATGLVAGPQGPGRPESWGYWLLPGLPNRPASAALCTRMAVARAAPPARPPVLERAASPAAVVPSAGGGTSSRTEVRRPTRRVGGRCGRPCWLQIGPCVASVVRRSTVPDAWKFIDRDDFAT